MGLSNIGIPEMLVLLVLGLLIFGPERLPKAAAEAVRMVRQLRQMARGAANDLKAELGPEMADLDLRSLHPRHLMDQVWSDDEPTPADAAVGRGDVVPLAAGERPPYDPDAT